MRFKVKFIHYVFSIGEVRARSMLLLGLTQGENMTGYEKINKLRNVKVTKAV